MTLTRPILCLVAGPADCRGRPLHRIVAAAVEGGITLFQLRDKTATHRQLVETARRLRPILDRAGVPLVINDSVAAAAEANAGVHVGQSDASAEEARRRLGPDALIGLSVGSLDDARAAAAAPVDCLGAGVFATPTKSDNAPLGLDGLAAVCRISRRPVIAIGGLGPDTAAAAMAAGAAGIAVVSAIAGASDPRAAAAALRNAIA